MVQLCCSTGLTGASAIAQQGNTSITKLLQRGAAISKQRKPVKRSGLQHPYCSAGQQGGATIILSDGTKVWLNAASSPLRYPVALQEMQDGKSRGGIVF